MSEERRFWRKLKDLLDHGCRVFFEADEVTVYWFGEHEHTQRATLFEAMTAAHDKAVHRWPEIWSQEERRSATANPNREGSE